MDIQDIDDFRLKQGANINPLFVHLLDAAADEWVFESSAAKGTKKRKKKSDEKSPSELCFQTFLQDLRFFVFKTKS